VAAAAIIDTCCQRPTSAANPPAVAAAVDRRDRQTDGQTKLDRFMTLTTYSAGRVINSTVAYLYIAAWDESNFAFESSFKPVWINSPDNTENVTFVERQFAKHKITQTNNLDTSPMFSRLLTRFVGR